MKISKYVSSLKGYEKASEWEQESTQETLNAIKTGKIYAMIASVSKSGMARKIKFFYTKKNLIVNCTPQIAWLYGSVTMGEYTQGGKYLNENGLNVKGCGMDMIFHTLYSSMPCEEAREWNQRYSAL